MLLGREAEEKETVRTVDGMEAAMTDDGKKNDMILKWKHSFVRRIIMEIPLVDENISLTLLSSTLPMG